MQLWCLDSEYQQTWFCLTAEKRRHRCCVCEVKSVRLTPSRTLHRQALMQGNCFYQAGCLLLSEHVAGLLCYADEGGSAAQLLEFGCTHVGAGGAEPPKDVPDRVFYIPSVRNLHRPTLRRPGNKHEKKQRFIYLFKKLKAATIKRLI